MIYKALFIALVAVVIVVPLTLVHQLGFLLHFYQHHPGTCRQVKGAGFGSEDLHVVSSGIAFVTSGMSWSTSSPDQLEWWAKNNVKGRILLFDFNKQGAEAKELKIKPTKSLNMDTFRPHGMNILEDKVKGEHLLYVINHAIPEADRVEKFRYLPKTGELLHIKSIKSEFFRGTNNLALTGEDKFYISNYMYYSSRALNWVEIVLKLKFGNIIYFDGKSSNIVDSGIFGPNGVALSKDGRHLYVVFPLEKSLRVYARQSDDSLQLLQDIYVHTSCDNIHLSEDGNSFFTGCHPITHKIVRHMEDPGHLKSPSQILHFKLRNGKIDPEEGTEVLYDHGDLLSGSTIAAVYKNRMLIGTIFDNLAVCELGAPET